MSKISGLFYLMMAAAAAAVMMCATARRTGERLHFQNSAELMELDTDQRVGLHHDERNHRGRTPLTTVHPRVSNQSATVVTPSNTNLVEEESTPAATSKISFDNRSLFYQPPRCKDNEILSLTIADIKEMAKRQKFKY